MEIHCHFRWTLMCIRESYDKRQTKQGVSYNISFECIFFEKKNQFNSNFFPIKLIYDINKIYPSNPHFMLYPLV